MALSFFSLFKSGINFKEYQFLLWEIGLRDYNVGTGVLITTGSVVAPLSSKRQEMILFKPCSPCVYKYTDQGFRIVTLI